MITQEHLVKDFQKLGIAVGDLLLVHASLSRIGQVDGGAQTVVDALLSAVGEQGTLLMSTFQAGSEFELLSAGLCFDVRETPSELGAITECFRKMPDAQRSLSPTYAVSGIGPRAAELLAGHEQCTVSTGHASPFEKLGEHGGKILLLGVDHSANTTLHYVENTNGAPTVSSKLFSAQVRNEQGEALTVKMFSHMPPGMQRQYPRAEALLLAAGIQRNGLIGAAESRLIDAGPMIQLLAAKVRDNPLFFIEAFKAPLQV